MRRFISWNINGFRAILKKGFVEFVKEHDPDILCLQETKTQSIDLPLDFPQEYLLYSNFAEKKGYSGTTVLTKEKPISVTKGMGIDKHDKEGRLLTLEYEDFFLVNVYTPNAQRGLTRLDYKQEWNRDFLSYLKVLENKKPVIFCGDLNVAHQEIDIARPKDNRKNAGFTDEERFDFSKIINSGFIDTFRMFNKEGGNYSWWSYMHDAREKNIGWRIDYFCVSEVLKSRVKDALILSNVMGSDHAPVGIVFK